MQSLTTIVIVTCSLSLIFATILISMSGCQISRLFLYSGHLSKADNKFGPESVRFRESLLYINQYGRRKNIEEKLFAFAVKNRDFKSFGLPVIKANKQKIRLNERDELFCCPNTFPTFKLRTSRNYLSNICLKTGAVNSLKLRISRYPNLSIKRAL